MKTNLNGRKCGSPLLLGAKGVEFLLPHVVRKLLPPCGQKITP